MDISSVLGTLMSPESLQGIGKATNTKSSTVSSVLSAALPSLISGAQNQCSDTSTGFADALLAHGKEDTSDLASFMGKVDLKDGGKIISHLLGSNSSAQIESIAQSSGTSNKNVSGILSAAAPLLMSLLGKQAASSSSESSSSAINSIAASLLKNVDVVSLLGGILGGSNSSGKEGAASGIIGNVLGKIFK